MNENLFELLRAHFPADAARPFIEAKDGRVHSYADLDRQSGRIARLLADLGVRKGDRVATQVDKSPEAVFLYLACLRAGAIYLPLNTAYTAREVAFFLSDAEPRCVICRPEAERQTRELARTAGVEQVLTLGGEGGGSLTEAALGLDPAYPAAAAEADDIAAILYTSGTTGRPKGAMLSHGNLASNAEALHRVWGFDPDDVLLHALPIFHTHGLFVAINTTILNGTKMIFLPRFDAEEVIALLSRATVFMGVPSFYSRLLARPELTAEACRGLRLFIAGSAPLLEETFREFKARTGFTILERYGMTEAGMITSNPLEGERRAGSVGIPLPGIEVRVADEDGSILGTDEVGVLEVRGPNVFSGYWRLPEKTAEEFRADGFFITGDMAKIDERGYVHIVGRAKDLIISGGYNVYPKEVELCLDRIEGVAESAVIGLPHPDFGEAVTAVVTRKPGGEGSGAEALTADAVVDHAKRELANYKVPKRIIFVDELPRNAMGKVQKNLLRERYKSAFSSAA